MVSRTRKKNPKMITTTSGVTIETCYCRKCMQNKSPNDFYEATDTFLDGNHKFSVCKLCCNDIYERFFRNEGSIERGLLKTCRLLNVRYDEEAIGAAKQHRDTLLLNGKTASGFFGLYKAKLVTVQKTNMRDMSPRRDLTFEEPTQPIFVSEKDEEFQRNNIDLQYFWGDKFTEEDFIFLEKEFAEWKNKHKCDTKAEETLLKEICLKSMDIRKQRNLGASTASLVKELQDLMKTASVDPSKTSAAGSGKSQDTFSAFIKTIEENDPADYYKDKSLFKDFDNIDHYFKKYVTRPLKNFITQSRDFNTDNDSDDEENEILGDNEETIDAYVTSSLQE